MSYYLKEGLAEMKAKYAKTGGIPQHERYSLLGDPNGKKWEAFLYAEWKDVETLEMSLSRVFDKNLNQ